MELLALHQQDRTPPEKWIRTARRPVGFQNPLLDIVDTGFG